MSKDKLRILRDFGRKPYGLRLGDEIVIFKACCMRMTHAHEEEEMEQGWSVGLCHRMSILVINRRPIWISNKILDRQKTGGGSEIGEKKSQKYDYFQGFCNICILSLHTIIESFYREPKHTKCIQELAKSEIFK